jgi:hypothetical protein
MIIQAVVECFKDVGELLIIMLECKVVKILIMGIDFHEGVETPHQVIAKGT